MKKKRPAIFLDRDGVIIKEKNFLIDPDDIEFIPETIEAFDRINDKFAKVIVSNQSGISRGLFSAEDVEKFNEALSNKLSEKGIFIDGWYFCPHGPDDDCKCRKPQPGMIFTAAVELNIDLENSWIIGDKSSDIAAGKSAGVRAILVKTGYGGNEDNASEAAPIYIANNILDAINYINRSAS